MSDSGPDDRYSSPVLNHVGHCITDLARSERFYCDLLGFEVERRLVLPDEVTSDFLGVPAPVGLTAVYLRLGVFVLELIHFDRAGNPEPPQRRFNEAGLTHLSISVVDLDAVVERVPEFGGTVVNRSSMASIVRDPDGQFVELLPMSYRRRLDGA